MKGKHLVPVPMRDRIRGYWGELKRLRAADVLSDRRLIWNAERGLAAAQRTAVAYVNAVRAERRAAA